MINNNSNFFEENKEDNKDLWKYFVILGDFNIHGSETKPTLMNSFLNAIDSNFKKNETILFYNKKNDLQCLFVSLKNYFDGLMYNTWFKKASLVLMLPNSEEDFKCCVNALNRHCPDQKNIYYVNQDKEFCSIASEDIRSLEYHYHNTGFDENLLDQLLNLSEREQTHTQISQNISNDDASEPPSKSPCVIL